MGKVEGDLQGTPQNGDVVLLRSSEWQEGRLHLTGNAADDHGDSCTGLSGGKSTL